MCRVRAVQPYVPYALCYNTLAYFRSSSSIIQCHHSRTYQLLYTPSLPHAALGGFA